MVLPVSLTCYVSSHLGCMLLFLLRVLREFAPLFLGGGGEWILRSTDRASTLGNGVLEQSVRGSYVVKSQLHHETPMLSSSHVVSKVDRLRHFPVWWPQTSK